MLIVIFIAATFTLYSSAAYNYSISGGAWTKTDITGTDVSHTFYISSIPGSSTLYSCFIRGGNKANFRTLLDMRLSNGLDFVVPTPQPATYTSDDPGRTNVIEINQSAATYDFERVGYGVCFTEYRCTSKTNSSDYWLGWYFCRWSPDKGWITVSSEI